MKAKLAMASKTGPFLSFDKQDRKIGAKTDWWIVWPVVSVAGPLGVVEWFPHWRKYTFKPSGGTVLDATCMLEVSEFIVKQTELHRKGKRTFEGQ
jgi:hypothetical protein